MDKYSVGQSRDDGVRWEGGREGEKREMQMLDGISQLCDSLNKRNRTER